MEQKITSRTKTSTPTEASPHPLDHPQLPPKTLFSWLMFIPAVLLFILCLIVFEVLQVVCGWIGPRAAEWSRSMLQHGFYYYLYFLGTHYDIRVPKELDPARAYILVSNHQSMFDIPLLFLAFRSKSPRYISKIELGRGVPTISRYLRTDGSALIERDNPRQSLPAIKALAKRANEEKFGIAIFPEGTRARAGVLKPFRSSGLKILFQNAPEAVVLPVAIDGSWKFTCFAKGPIPLGVRFSVWAGEEITRDGKTTEQLVAECETQVRDMLRAIRAEQ